MSTTQKPPLPRTIINHGGIVHTFRAHIACAECTACDDFEMDAEATTLELFGTAARRYFAEERNWHCGRPDTLCHECWLGDECESCMGYGHIDAKDNPTVDRRCRKCLDCTGTGRIARARS